MTTNSDEYYANYYSQVLNTGLVGRISDFAHQVMEYPYSSKSYFNKVLELGSAEGQHRKFIRHGYDLYLETDLRISGEAEVSFASNNGGKVERFALDAQDLSRIGTNSIDRIVATCLLVHLPNPERALSEWRRVVRQDGIVSIFVPTEPGLLLRVFRQITTVPKSKSRGINHKSIHYREHRNMWIFCNLLINEIFKGDLIIRRRYPFRFLPWNLSLVDIYDIRISKKQYDQ